MEKLSTDTNTMDALSRDPIIAFYLKMCKSTEFETELPVFSETTLRLAMKQTLIQFHSIKDTEVQLYRKLLLLYYSKIYVNTADLLFIMTCFDEQQVHMYLKKGNTILSEWGQFSKDVLRNALFKEAFIETLYEWTKRYYRLHGDITKKHLQHKAKDLKHLLGWDNLNPLWFQKFESLAASRNLAKAAAELENITEEDLQLTNIFESVKHKFSTFVTVEDLKRKAVAKQQPEAKRTKQQEIMKIEILDQTILQSESIKNEDKMKYEKETIIVPKQQPEAKEVKEREILKIEILDQLVFGQTKSIKAEEEFIYENQVIVDESGPADSAHLDPVNNNDAARDPAEEVVEHIDSDSEAEGDNDCLKIQLRKIHSSSLGIIDYSTALTYLSALQAYAVVNGHFEAICLLDKVDSDFRSKFM